VLSFAAESPLDDTTRGLSNAIDKIDESTIGLGLELAVAAGFVLLMVVIHSLGLMAISHLLRLNDDRLKRQEMNARAILLMAQLGLSMFVLHLVEIAIFAAFYVYVADVQTAEHAILYSASTYTTLGAPGGYVGVEWRLIGAIEGLIGFVLIGWSTAFMVSTMRKLSEHAPGR
jgi:hypothetical protein